MKAYIYKHNLSPAPQKAEPVAQSVVAPKPEAPKAESAVQNTSSRPSNVNPEYEPDFEDIELSNMRKVIAKRLLLSKV